MPFGTVSWAPPTGVQSSSHLALLKSKLMVHSKTGYIAILRALPSETNHGRHIEVPFQTKVLKISHFKVPFGMKDFEGEKLIRAPMILCTDSLHDYGASSPYNDAEGHFKKQLFGPLHPSTLSKLSLRRVTHLKGLGHIYK